MDEASRLASNFAKLPALLGGYEHKTGETGGSALRTNEISCTVK